MVAGFVAFVDHCIRSCDHGCGVTALGGFLECLGSAHAVSQTETAVKVLVSLHNGMSPRRKELVNCVLTAAHASGATLPLSVLDASVLLQRLVTEKGLPPLVAITSIVSRMSPADVAAARTVLVPEAHCLPRLRDMANFFKAADEVAIAATSAAAAAAPPPRPVDTDAFAPPAKHHRTEDARSPRTTGAASPAAASWLTTTPGAGSATPPPAGHGTDPPPPAPMDPEHPQRVVGATTEKVIHRMRRQSAMDGFIADVKYDGERLLARRLPDGTFAFHSRNMLVVPDKKVVGIPAMLMEAFAPWVHSFAIDAEILSTHTHGSMNACSKADIAEKGPRVYIFDLVWLNGHSLATLPRKERRQRLLACLRKPHRGGGGGGGSRGIVCESVYFPGGSDEAMWRAHTTKLADFIRLQFAKGVEGVVAKPLALPYKFGGTSWVKIKKDYLVDLAVPGGF
jgi:hypothetical protein